MGYSLGMVKIEAFDDRRFMHQTIRVCMTEGGEERKGGRRGEGITHQREHVETSCYVSSTRLHAVL